MNLWYTVSGDEEEGLYEFERFETKEQTEKHIPRIRSKFKKV